MAGGSATAVVVVVTGKRFRASGGCTAKASKSKDIFRAALFSIKDKELYMDGRTERDVIGQVFSQAYVCLPL